jgi:hypothetical protein
LVAVRHVRRQRNLATGYTMSDFQSPVTSDHTKNPMNWCRSQQWQPYGTELASGAP